MKIRFLQPEKSRFGDWQPGDEEDVHDPEAERLIAAGIAEKQERENRSEEREASDLAPRSLLLAP